MGWDVLAYLSKYAGDQLLNRVTAETILWPRELALAHSSSDRLAVRIFSWSIILRPTGLCRHLYCPFLELRIGSHRSEATIAVTQHMFFSGEL